MQIATDSQQKVPTFSPSFLYDNNGNIEGLKAKISHLETSNLLILETRNTE